MNNFNEALKENRTRYQARLLKETKRQERIHKIELGITILIGMFIILLTTIVLKGMTNNTDEAMEKCINDGHSTNYCARTV